MDKLHFVKELQAKIDLVEQQLILSPERTEELQSTKKALRKQLNFLMGIPEDPSSSRRKRTAKHTRTKQTFPLESIEKIPSLLNRLTTEGSDNNFLILYLNKDRNFFIQFASQKDSDTIICLAVSNAYLEKKNWLSSDQITRMSELGWQLNNDHFSKHFKIEYKITQKDTYLDLIELVKKTAIDCFETPLISGINVVLNIE
ncbi:MAG: hypothetical protein AAF985_16405 [Bacteroidota bacterium]